MILDMATEETATATEETLALVLGKEKEMLRILQRKRILVFKTYLVKSCLRLRRKS
jgi:hypothetical protein